MNLDTLRDAQALLISEREREASERGGRPTSEPCPFPICGDDGTSEMCIANGHCGCDEMWMQL